MPISPFMPYLPRIVDEERLRSSGAVLVHGPNACGKTATARRHAKSEDLLDAEVGATQKMQVDPRLLLGDPPHLLDEWQVFPDPWNYVRREVDARGIPGQFILTGSATPSDDATRHSGAGRFARIQMRPMSLLELGNSSGVISLARLFDGEVSRSTDPGLTLDDPLRGHARWVACQSSDVASGRGTIEPRLLRSHQAYRYQSGRRCPA